MEEKYTLIRFFDEEEYIETFRSGELRMMSAKYYKEAELKSGKLYNNRYDSFENSTYVYNPKSDGTINFVEPLGADRYTHMWINPKVLKSPVIIGNDRLDQLTKISCFYKLPMENLPEGKIESSISTMEDSLGDYYCLIIDMNEFSSRIKNGILKYCDKKIIKRGELGSVEYVNESTFNGRYGTFLKPSGLSWQREYRIGLISESNNDPFWFNIGSLKDITIWGKVSDLINARFNEDGGLIISNFYT